MTETETKTEIVSAEEIATLNEARTILGRLHKDAPFTYNGGRFKESCERAGNAIFQALNVMNAYSIQGLTSAELHNQPEGEES